MHDFEIEHEQSRTQVAAALRKMADGLEAGNTLTFVVDDESATINPPEQLHTRMETSSDSSWLGGEDGRSFVIELGWEADEVETDDELTIISRTERHRTDDTTSARP